MRPAAILLIVLLTGAPLVGCLATRSDLTGASGLIAGWSGHVPAPATAAAIGPIGSATPSVTNPVPQGSSPVCYVLAPRLPRPAAGAATHPATGAATSPATHPATGAAAEPGLAWIEAVCEGQVDPTLTLSVQRALTRLGYLPGDEDGRYGPRTGAAIERFKRDRLIYGDGLTAETLSALSVAWQRPPALTRESR